MEDSYKLLATRAFYDSLAKRSIPQGVMFYTSKERALKIVGLGFANIVERPSIDADTSVEKIKTEDKKQVVKTPTKKVAIKKSTVKKPAKK